MSQIICNNITLGYDGKAVVENLSFSVEKGDYLCILGENGAGKSTLVKALLKLKKPMSGEIVMDESAERTGIGYLPQQTEIQRDFPASVYEIVLSGCVRGLGKKPFFGRQQKKLAMENMKKLGIENLAKCCYRELSGGQQQRALLARALCASKNILLLDEPAAGLDPVATNEMYSIISDLNKTQNITIVMVSHDIKAAVRYAKHILHIGHQPLFFGNTEDYILSPVGKAFLNPLGKGEKEQ